MRDGLLICDLLVFALAGCDPVFSPVAEIGCLETGRPDVAHPESGHLYHERLHLYTSTCASSRLGQHEEEILFKVASVSKYMADGENFILFLASRSANYR